MKPPSSPELAAEPGSALEAAETSAESPPLPSASRAGLIVTLILLGALALRLWGITWALPNQDRYFTYHPDEGVNLVNGVLENGVFRPHLDLKFYNYGSLYFYLWQGAGAINRAYRFVSLPHTDPPHTPSPDSIASLIAAGRVLTVLLGALTVWAVFALGRRLYGNRVGIWSALFISVVPLAGIHGKFATVDVPATFFVACALAVGARLLESPRIRDVVLVGVLCGLAAATKYNAGLVLAAPLAALFIRRETLMAFARSAFVLIISSIAAFLIACPGPLLNAGEFWKDFTFELTKSGQGMGLLFKDTGIGWVYHLTNSLRFGLGLPLLLFSLLAVGIAIARRRAEELYLMSFLLLYYLVIGAAQVKFMRYVVPMLPVLAVLCGRIMAADWTVRRPALLVCRAFGVLALVSALGISLVLSRLMTVPDARDQAREFIRTRIPQGQVLAFARVPWYDVPPLSPMFTAPDPRARREAAETLGTYAVRLPRGDREVDPSVFEPTLPDAAILSDIATQDWDRLRTPGWTAFKERLDREYSARVFENEPAIFGVSLGKPAHVPNDLLYIYPRVTVYTRNP